RRQSPLRHDSGASPPPSPAQARRNRGYDASLPRPQHTPVFRNPLSGSPLRSPPASPQSRVHRNRDPHPRTFHPSEHRHLLRRERTTAEKPPLSPSGAHGRDLHASGRNAALGRAPSPRRRAVGTASRPGPRADPGNLEYPDFGREPRVQIPRAVHSV